MSVPVRNHVPVDPERPHRWLRFRRGRTVALGGVFRKIAGVQAPGVNDGSLVSEVALADRDGLVLIR